MYALNEYENALLRRLNDWRKKHIEERRFLLLLAFLAGIGAALATQCLKILIEQIEFLLTFQFDQTKAQWLYLVYPFIGILICALFIKYVVRDNISHGITKILHAISKKQGHIAHHNCWSSVIASSFTIGFGGSVGGESPIVLTGSAIGSALGDAFKLDHKSLMILVGCGATAAIAGIFKAPIAGIVFTLEILMIDLTMSALLPLLVSALTATCVTYIFRGTDSMFSFQLSDPFIVQRIPTSIILGIFCGLISLYYTKMMSHFEQFFGKIKNLYIKVIAGGSVLAVLIYFFPPLYGEGYHTINTIINADHAHGIGELMNNSFFYGKGEYMLMYLTFIMFTKVFATTATNGGGGCGGTFAPTLFLGCVTGYVFAMVWNMFELIGIHVPSTNYALLGMAGLMSGVFHAPLTGVFLIAELTGGYHLFIPLMIVSATAFLTINIFERHNIYAIRLARKGQLLTHNKDTSILTLMSLDTVIKKDIPTLSPEMTLGDLVKIISRSNEQDFAVTDRKGTLLGVINVMEIRHVVFRSELYRKYTVEKLMRPAVAVLSTEDTMQHVMDTFQNTQAEELPVLRPNHTFVGFISKTKLFTSYRQIIKDFSEE